MQNLQQNGVQNSLSLIRVISWYRVFSNYFDLFKAVGIIIFSPTVVGTASMVSTGWLRLVLVSWFVQGGHKGLANPCCVDQ